MTPADIIRPFLQEADRRKPHLRITNLHASCFELLEDTLALAGPDWMFVGKTIVMDGAGYRPWWFTPKVVSCRRPDGQFQEIQISQLGMDAAWYIPTMRQVKVITNSTANEPGPHEKGPAGLDSYDIDEKDYRWHNPPMPQRLGVVVKPMPAPPPPPTRAFPYPDEVTLVKAFQGRVEKAYKAIGRIFPDPNDSDAYRHFVRYGYDCHDMDAQAAADKRIRELRVELGAPREP